MANSIHGILIQKQLNYTFQVKETFQLTNIVKSIWILVNFELFIFARPRRTIILSVIISITSFSSRLPFLSLTNIVFTSRKLIKIKFLILVKKTVANFCRLFLKQFWYLYSFYQLFTLHNLKKHRNNWRL